MEPVQRVLTVADYQALISRVREAVHQNIRGKATVIVISKGDDRLVQLNGIRAWHFPQNPEGVYSGHYLANSAEVIISLEGLCSKGAEYLVLPQTSFWWLDYYDGFRTHLDSRHQRIWSDDDCIIYRLAAGEAKA